METAFGIVAEPNRRAILSLLAGAERSVSEIEGELRMSQPSVSKHLRVLRDAGFVEARVEGQRRVYHIRAEPLQEVDAWLEPFRRFWTERVDALEAHLERMERGNMDSRFRGNDGVGPKGNMDSRFRGNDGKACGNDGGECGNDGGLE